MHLLLASQRLEEGRLRGLDTHLSYRIGLRTFSALESRAVLGVPDAYELPRSPGHGYLKFGTEPLLRFKAAYVSGPYRRPGTIGPGGRPAPERAWSSRTRHASSPAPDAGAAETVAAPEEAGAESLLDVMVDRLAGQGPPAHQVWLPPLSEAPALDELLGPVVTDPGARPDRRQPGAARRACRCRWPSSTSRSSSAATCCGCRWTGAAGHVAVVGGTAERQVAPLLRTLICGARR